MAQQYLDVYSVNEGALRAVVGSGDRNLAKRAAAETLRRLEELSLDPEDRQAEYQKIVRAVESILAGRLDPASDYAYFLTLPVMLALAGKLLGTTVLEGRGWTELKGWERIGLGPLDSVWGKTNSPFPWDTLSEGRAAMYPRAMRFAPEDVPILVQALEDREDGVDLTVLFEDEDDRDEREYMGESLDFFLAKLRGWAAEAQGANESLYLWHFGAMG